jgi:hypothetical protein
VAGGPTMWGMEARRAELTTRAAKALGAGFALWFFAVMERELKPRLEQPAGLRRGAVRPTQSWRLDLRAWRQ